MPRGGHHGDTAEAADVGGQVGGALRQAGLRLSARRGCLPLSSWRAAAISLHKRRSWQDATALLDNGMFRLLAQIPMHNRTGAADHAMGARASARSRAAAP